MTDLAVQDIDPQILYEAPHNPRTIDPARFEQLKRSLVADPEMLRARPVIALPSGEVVAGNMRLRAVRELGWATVPTVYADLDDQRAREWMLRDNNEFGVWQDDSLSDLLAELQAGATDLSLLGFEDGELERLLDLAGGDGSGEVGEDPGSQLDRAAELREKWQVSRGDLWLIGRHRLLCGDSTSAEDVARLMGGERAAVLLADPPYGIGYHSNQPAYRGGDRFVDREFGADEFDSTWLPVWVGVMLDEGHAYVFTRWDVLGRWQAAMENAGVVLRQRLIWDKSHWTMGNLDYYGTQTEDILYGTKGSPPLYWEQRRGNLIKTPNITFSPDDRSPHATQKPVAVIEPLIQDSSRTEAVVADPFLGSGTTMVAAEQTGRRCCGMEIEPKYVAVALERLAGMGLEPCRG